MTARQVVASVAFLCLLASVVHADTVVLKNGAELRNVKIVEEREHTVKINIIEYTNVVIGRGNISRIEKEGGAAVTPAPGIMEPSPARPPTPARQLKPTSHKVYKLPTDAQGKYVEVVIDVWDDGTTDVEVRPPSGEPGERQSIFALTAEAGEKIEFQVERDDFGAASGMTIKPPEPPRTSPKDLFEHTVKDVDGKILKIQAKWDWNTRQLLDLQFLP